MPAPYQPVPNTTLHVVRASNAATYLGPGGVVRPSFPFETFFPNGTIGIRQNPVLRSVVFSSPVLDFYGTLVPGQYPTWPGLPDDTRVRGFFPKTPSGVVETTLYDPDGLSSTRARILTPLNFVNGRLGAYIIKPLTLVPGKGTKFEFFPNGTLLLGGLELGTGGALTDFAFWASGSSDPMDILVEDATAGTSGTVGNDWTRHHAVVVPPAKARYMAIGGLFANQTHLLSQSLYAAQVEVLPVGTTAPSAYTEPREIRLIIRPERMNWSKNPSFINNVTGWTNVTRTANAEAPSGFSGDASLTANVDKTIEHTVSGLLKGRTYMIKAKVTGNPGMTMTASVGGGGTGVIGSGNTYEITAHGATATTPPVTQPPGPGGTKHPPNYMPIREIPVTEALEAPPPPNNITMLFEQHTDADTVFTFVAHPTANGTVKFLSILVEDTEDTTREFFDGNTPGDYFWETGQTDGSSRSYYYKNFLARYKTVKGILEADAPMGVGVADPQYGVPPTD